MMKFARPHRGALAATLSLTLMLGACSGETSEESRDRGSLADPPGAAAALSLGGRVSSEGDSESDVAVNCAAALRITARTLSQMTSGAQSQEIQMINRTADIFEQRAGDQRAAGDATGGSTQAAIERRVAEETEKTGEQAQLAIACLRRIEDSL